MQSPFRIQEQSKWGKGENSAGNTTLKWHEVSRALHSNDNKVHGKLNKNINNLKTIH